MKRKPHRFFLYLLLRLGLQLVRLLPRALLLRAAKWGGGVAFAILPRYRNATVDHLQTGFGAAKPVFELRAMARRVFSNTAMSVVDWAKWGSLSPRQRRALFTCRSEDVQKIKDLLAGGKGLVVTASHLGNWELLAAFFADQLGRAYVVGRRIYYEPFNRVIVSLRKAWNVHTLYRDGSAKEILTVLKRGEIVGMLGDQDVRSVEGVFVPFFGRPARTPTGLVKLAMAAGAPMISMACVREGRQYRIIVGEPIWPAARANREETVRYYTARWTEEVEALVRQYPDQWMWMHDRWKTRPPETEDTASVMVKEA